MVNAIIKGIFYVITKLFDIIFSPFLNALFLLFPNLTTYFNAIINFLNMGLTYVRSILALLLINDTMITALFDYFIILYSIYLIILVVRFAINIYNKLKI